jgi:capsular polysaccharide biosynthesis protein
MPSLIERALSKLGVTNLIRKIEPIRQFLSLPSGCYYGNDFEGNIVGAEALPLQITSSETQYLTPSCLNKHLFPHVELPGPPCKADIFAIVLPNAFVWGRLGGVITKEGIFIDQVSHAFGLKGWRHPVWKKLRLSEQKVLHGVSLSLAGPASSNYFHWLAQLFPKLSLILEHSNISINEIDYVIISGPVRAFHIESLEAVGINESKIVILEDESYLQCTKLLCTSFLTAGSAPWAIDWLQKQFTSENSSISKRIYISRGDASTRRLLNETELVKLISTYEFESIQLEGLTVEEQANLFASAEAVLSPHGAGLTNIVFSMPGTKVFEIFSETWTRATYYLLSHQCNHEYSCCIGSSKENNPHSDYTADLNAISEWLDML